MKSQMMFWTIAALVLTHAMAAQPPVAEPVKVNVSLSQTPNEGVEFPYVPAQATAPYPDRLLPLLRRNVGGVSGLAPDRQKPIPGGVDFTKGCGYRIHHRRAGVYCQDAVRIRFRMELFWDMATMALAVRTDDRVIPLTEFDQQSFQAFPNNVRYRFYHPQLDIEMTVSLVPPVSIPAYGVVGQIVLQNKGSKQHKLDLIAIAEPGRNAPEIKLKGTADKPYLKLDLPQENPLVDPARPEKGRILLHDTDYDLLIGFDGDITATDNAVIRPVNLTPYTTTSVQLIAFLDSPGFEEEKVTQQITDYFNKNENLSESTRKRMIKEALGTFVWAIVYGDIAFQKVRNDFDAFRKSLIIAGTGMYRRQPVLFELPDKKLESLANITANDYFPGLVQPPGIVHDAKNGDIWNYIFCYRHVHAALDFALEGSAIDYMRLLSCNQQPSGQVHSIRADFKNNAHPTALDASYIDAFYHYYKWTADYDTLLEMWPTLTRTAEYIESSLDPDGDDLYRDLIHQWKSDFDNRGPSSSFQTAIVWKAYTDLAEFAQSLGYFDKAQEYSHKAKTIHKTAMEQLWSDDKVMLGPKGPLGMLRLHPQSLEVEIPIWTGFVDEYQGYVLADWYLANMAMYDEKGGIWMCNNDWWPAVWSQHVPAPGDYLMIGWALMLTGQHEAGCNILQTVAGGSYRSDIPGYNYIFTPEGVHGSGDPATVQGAFGRALVEGLFGIRPQLDKKQIVIQPRFPDDWPLARFQRPGLEVTYTHQNNEYSIRVKTPPSVSGVIHMPIRKPVTKVLVDNKSIDFKVKPSMRYGIVTATTPPGGGRIVVETKPVDWKVEAPDSAAPGKTVTIKLRNIEKVELDDRFEFFDVVKEDSSQIQFKLKKTGCGRAVVFLKCRKDNLRWIEPVSLWTMPRYPKDFVRQTVRDPLPPNSRLVPLDLQQFYTDDIQACFTHKWKWDAYDFTMNTIGYWTMPLFKLTKTLPQKLTIGTIPFHIGLMGPGQAEKHKDLLMLANTPPHELPTSATIDIGGRHLHKIYLLSLNMNLPQKCYVPAAEVLIHYTDGTTKTEQLIPPLNFDTYYQDYGINTMAYHLDTEPAYGQKQWHAPFGFDLQKQHLTATDIQCDPTKAVESFEIKSIATETFFGLSAVTLLEFDHESAATEPGI